MLLGWEDAPNSRPGPLDPPGTDIGKLRPPLEAPNPVLAPKPKLGALLEAPNTELPWLRAKAPLEGAPPNLKLGVLPAGVGPLGVAGGTASVGWVVPGWALDAAGPLGVAMPNVKGAAVGVEGG